MNKTETDITFITADSIISKFNAYQGDYTVFTTHSGYADKKYQSIIRFTEHNKTLWSLHADTITDALLNHIALVNLANECSVLSWNVQLLEASKPMQIVEALHKKYVFAKEHTFVAPFTRKLFKAAGVDAMQTEPEMNVKIIVAFVAAFIFGLLSVGFNL